MRFHACWLHYIYDTMCTWFNLKRRWHLKHWEQNNMAVMTFSDDIFRCIFLNEDIRILIRDDPVQWRIYASPGLNELNVVLPSFLQIAHARLPVNTEARHMAAILQMRFSHSFSLMNIFEFPLQFHSWQKVNIGSSNKCCCVKLATSQPFPG